MKMSGFKESKYNYITERGDQVYIYNTLHRSFLSLQKNLWEGFLDGNAETFTESEFSLLQSNGIILPKSVDERYIFKDIMQSSCLQSNEISFFLSMTSLCNLSCPYCYQDCRIENKEKRFIDSEKIDILCRYLQKSKANKVNVVYFGGEPTLDTEQLIYAIHRINSLEGKSVNNTLITNGYSISDSLIAEIKTHESFLVQITLDGDRRLHDSTRVTHAKAGTYDIIIKNVDSLVNAITGKVCIRINVASYDFKPYERAIDSLAERYGDRIQVGLAAVFSGQKRKNEPELKDIVDILDLIEYAQSKGYDTMPSIEYAPCVATMRNSFAVDENLNVYICPARLYEKSVGMITDDARFAIHDDEWYNAIYERKACVEMCIYGGLCYGGCVMSKLECRKDLFERLLPYVVENKIIKYQKAKGSQK